MARSGGGALYRCPMRTLLPLVRVTFLGRETSAAHSAGRRRSWLIPCRAQARGAPGTMGKPLVFIPGPVPSTHRLVRPPDGL